MTLYGIKWINKNRRTLLDGQLFKKASEAVTYASIEMTQMEAEFIKGYEVIFFNYNKLNSTFSRGKKETLL